MPKQYRVGASVRFNNAVMKSLLRAGVRFGTFTILTVRGRKSGQPIETPLAVFEKDGNRYLVAPYGVVNWVRNLRAAGGEATLTSAHHTEKIAAVELPPEQAAPILRSALQTGPPGIPRLMVKVYRRFSVLPYLDVDMNSTTAEFERAAASHPIFLVRTAA
ncbi:nitroreductase family deazaflavin-dependent oxidoreductase [Mycobacterium sp.]|uniref:nitroreductase family deazaflavin-dependent oxidoreductase n=1 Tax=Mycobacterium sp. TaxID=1785 RepID=UPI002BA74EA8|nr:nitroreductase family deazaflavin-dependent oxidoreductase [Mycobacterium sp.]HTQ20200.1 nitroreductase family deazaflavin-dependent oxidoreductase [Mycobacterium sp.]